MTSKPTFVAYTTRINPHSLQISVVMTISADEALGQLDLIIPKWVPGDYEFEPYARDLFCVTAIDVKTKTPLTVKRNGLNGYQIQTGSMEILVEYQASCYEPAFGEATGLVDNNYAILLGTRYLHCPSYLGPCSVNYDQLPEDWSIHHPSGAVKEENSNTWLYPSFEILLDTPVVFGHFDLITKDICGTPFYYVFVDQAVGFSQRVNPFVEQLSVAAEKTFDIFGFFPFEDYTFVLSMNPQADWGLEHLTSNMSGLGPDVFVDDDQFAHGIRVCTHELFHAWNVRRLRPAPLGQLRYELSSGSFTEGLWMAEGFTRYYEFVLSTRAKAYNPGQLLSSIFGYYQHLSQQPAYTIVSATDSSYASYLNHAKYPGRVNNSIDYYDKGMLIAFTIDMYLRQQNKGQTLDTVFRDFYLRFFGENKPHSSNFPPPDYVGYSSDDVIAFYYEIDESLGRQVDRMINDSASLEIEEIFEEIGFSLNWQDGYSIGLFFMNESQPKIYGVSNESSSGEAGIAPEDIITSVDGFAYSWQGLSWAANQASTFEIGVLRGHRELKFNLLPQPIRRTHSLTWLGTEQQAQLIADWLHEPNFVPSMGEEFPLDFYENFHGIEMMI